MQRLPFSEEEGDTDVAEDGYLEFNFFDGVMVDCSNQRDVKRHSQEVSDILPSRQQTLCERTRGMLRDPEGRTRCMSSLGIHMCDCADGSVHCNLSTPSGGRIAIMKGSTAWDLQKDPSSSPLHKAYYRHDHHRQQSPSSTHEGYPPYGKASGNGFGPKSPLSAWASMVSNSRSCPSVLPIAGSSEALSHKNGLRYCGQQEERPPTLAYRLELTGAALDQCRSDSGDGGCVDSSSSLQAIAQGELLNLKMDLKSLSISEAAPYGTLHGILHCTFNEGLPNYTFLLDDYNEVITAKLWMEDMVLGSESGTWRYSFYSVRGETRRKGKTGWKHWSRKEKLTSILVAKMKLVSVLYVDEKQELSVKSECILYGTRPEDAMILKGVDATNQTGSSSSETDSLGSSSPSTTSMAAADVPSSMSSPSPTASPRPELQALMAPKSLVGARIPHKTQKWSLWPRFPSIRTKNADMGPKTLGPNACSKESLTDNFAWNHLKQSEIAAIIMDVPFEGKEKQKQVADQQRQASITAILPSGDHGGPNLNDINGPSPLISRWKEGGRCDCKGWDLGCGLTIVTNSICQKAQRFKEERRQGEALKLYKQDADNHEGALLCIAPQANGRVAIDFRAPLFPLQAVAIGVAILHGRNSEVPTRTAPHIIGSYSYRGHGNKEDGPLVVEDASDPKEAADKKAAGLNMLHTGMSFARIGQLAPKLAHTNLERL